MNTRRPTLLLALPLVALALGCPEDRTVLPAGLDGAHDLVVVGDLLFITATDDDELRVVDLASSPADFVRAPNPIHPLSVPVARRPVELARDVSWADGLQRGGRFVYSLSAGGQEVSVVAAGREGLVEQARIGSGLIGAARTVTALAARAGVGEEAASTLYLALSEQGEASLYTVTVPVSGTPVFGTALFTEPCAAITSILVLPDQTLALSLRRPRGAFERCTGPLDPEEDRWAALDRLEAETSFLLEEATGTRTVLEFPAPIRRLATHGVYAEVQPAARIFGLIDEDACRAPPCRGVLAVNGPGGAAPLGAWATDASGNPMRPVQVPALAMGLALGEGAGIVLPGGVEPPGGLLGVIPASNGRLFFFDAHNLRHFDLEPAGPSLPEVGAVNFFSPAGPPPFDPAAGGPFAIRLADGAARDEVLVVRYLGALPGFERRPAPSLPTAALDVAADPTGRVEPGDQVTLEGPACAAQLATVVSVQRRSVQGGRLGLDAPVGGEGCTYSVRPPPDAALPWVVSGSASGYLGRIAPGDEVQAPPPGQTASAYFHHPPGVDTSVPLLRMGFGAVPARPDDRYEVTTRGGFRTASAAVEPRSADQLRLRLEVAGAAQFREGSDRLLVTFPSGDVVVQFETGRITVDQGITRFEHFR